MGFGKDGKGQIWRDVTALTLGTLANEVAVKVQSLVPSEDLRLLKSEINAVAIGMTIVEGSGLLFGIADNELTVGEIGEAILADGPTDRNEVPEREQVERPVVVLSQLDMDETETRGVFRDMHSGAPTMINKKRWTYSNPEGWCYFVFNNTGGALTTGGSVRIQGTHYGLWLQ